MKPRTWTPLLPAILSSWFFAACSAGENDLEGAPCPCADGYQCCEADGICIDDQASCAHLGSSNWPLGAQHAACAQPAPRRLPVLPPINTDAAGRPLFDSWRDLDPEERGGQSCAAGSDTCGIDVCKTLDTESGEGVCVSPDSDIWCDGEGQVLSWRDGACWLCTTIEAHAAACAEGIAGVDCRAWPYPSDGKPGMVCAAHEDCEPGLICGRASDEDQGTGYGICQCPGLTSAPRPADTCFSDRDTI